MRVNCWVHPISSALSLDTTWWPQFQTVLCSLWKEVGLMFRVYFVLFSSWTVIFYNSKATEIFLARTVPICELKFELNWLPHRKLKKLIGREIWVVIQRHSPQAMHTGKLSVLPSWSTTVNLWNMMKSINLSSFNSY